MIRALWHYRYFIASSVKNDFKNRLVRSKVGFMWLVIQPLVMALIFTLILSQLMQAKFEGISSVYAYPIYLLAGMLGWTVFSETILRSLNMFIENKSLIQKMAIPKVVIPAIVAGQVFVHSMIMFIAIFAVVLAIGHPFSLSWLLFPLVIVVSIVLATSIGLILGTMNVFIRDIGQLIPVLLQLGFWLTPIVYTLTILPESYQNYISYNPILYLIEIYQQLLLYGTPPSFSQWAGLVVCMVCFSLLGLYMFKKASPEMADEL